MEGTAPLDGEALPVRLEIDHPGMLTQSAVDELDVVLEHLDIADRYARDALAAAVRRPDSAPAQLFEAWQRDRGGDVEEFLRSLRAMKMVFTPDGGRANLDRVVLSYGAPDTPASWRITVRLPETPTGPEVDPAPRAGYR